MARLLCVQVVAFLGLFSFVTSIIVDLPDGKVEGITETTLRNNTYHSFLALRYAKPPVDDLRFKLPQPLDPWDGVYNATVEKNICFQTTREDPRESEDCLFINIFTPKNLKSRKVSADLPVMAFIHGGAYLEGSAYQTEGFGPKFFMEYGVILVAFQYRLGPFGFFSTNDTVLPGNLGLKDQVFALEWIRKNIKHFGGNPRKVTIFGESAGASSVSYHLLSPMSKGLFVGAIQESGSSLEPWSYQRYQKEITQKTAALIRPDLPIYDYNSTELYNLLKSFSAEEIDKASSQIINNYGPSAQIIQLAQGFAYSPVIEPEHKDAFLTERQVHLLESGKFNKVPVMIGVNSEEALVVVPNRNTFQFFEGYDEIPEQLVADDMHIKDPTTKTLVAKRIHDFYVGNSSFKEDKCCGLRYHSMHSFDKAAIREAELQAKHSSSVWFYLFTYDGKMGFNKFNRIHPWIPGMGNVTHGEEMRYMFNSWYSAEIPDSSNPKYFPDEDWVVHERAMTLWTNFAKYQNPTPKKDGLLQNIKWPRVKHNQFKYLDIGKHLKVVNDYPKSESYKFWKNLFNEFAVPPLDTF